MWLRGRGVVVEVGVGGPKRFAVAAAAAAADGASLSPHLLMLLLLYVQVNHRWVTVLKEDGDQRIYWKALQVCVCVLCCTLSHAVYVKYLG